MITRKQLIQMYINFFKSKNHKQIPNASLIPSNDPTVLFTTAGMHPLVPYLLGQKHPLGNRLVNIQKCLRTDDINEVGNPYHHTFFEMLGNWSLGDYWKKQAIEYSFEFLTKILKIPKNKISITCFKGDKTLKIPKDIESANIWKSLGISNNKIKFLGKKENWWGPAGLTGPCGPDTEIFINGFEIWNNVFMQYYKGEINTILVDAIHCLIDKQKGLNKELADILKEVNKRIIIVTNAPKEKIKSNIKNYDFEIFTLNKNPEKTNSNYFKQLIKNHKLNINKTIYFDHSKDNLNSAKKIGINSELYENNKQIKKFIEDNIFFYAPAKQKNIDTGMGVERTLAILNNLNDNYITETFLPIIKVIEKLSEKKYNKNKNTREIKAMRIIADHIKASVFILSEDIIPSNKEQGYILRRLIRRAVRYKKILGIKTSLSEIAKPVFSIYSDYSHVNKKRNFIINEINKEENKFMQTLEKGLNKFKKLIEKNKKLSGKETFLLYQSYGFPFEMTQELARENKIRVNEKAFYDELKKHQELSRTATTGKFKSGLADKSEKTTKLHTATHLLLAALKKILADNNIIQKGSNINPERLRLDFNFPRKLRKDEIKKIEYLVNEQIKKAIPVIKQEMSLEEAKKQGAFGVFEDKYKEKVFVYIINDFSKEICSGPHVKNTKELGKFKIIKESSISYGVRRIKAVLE